MATTEDFPNPAGGTIIPVAAADFLTDDMGLAAERGYVTIRFYDDAGGTNQVTPGAGTVVVTGSTDGVNFFSSMVADGSFNAIDAYLVTRAIPLATGPLKNAKITLAGITVATHFSAQVVRY